MMKRHDRAFVFPVQMLPIVDNFILEHLRETPDSVLQYLLNLYLLCFDDYSTALECIQENYFEMLDQGQIMPEPQNIRSDILYDPPIIEKLMNLYINLVDCIYVYIQPYIPHTPPQSWHSVLIDPVHYETQWVVRVYLQTPFPNTQR